MIHDETTVAINLVAPNSVRIRMQSSTIWKRPRSQIGKRGRSSCLVSNSSWCWDAPCHRLRGRAGTPSRSMAVHRDVRRRSAQDNDRILLLISRMYQTTPRHALDSVATNRRDIRRPPCFRGPAHRTWPHTRGRLSSREMWRSGWTERTIRIRRTDPRTWFPHRTYPP